MTNALAKVERKGAGFAARARRSWATHLLAFLAVIFLAMPASISHADHASAHGRDAHLSMNGVFSVEDQPSSDGGLAHHCAQHCGCHQAMAVDQRLLPVATLVSDLRFPVIARAVCERAIAPPQRPPQA